MTRDANVRRVRAAEFRPAAKTSEEAARERKLLVLATEAVDRNAERSEGCRRDVCVGANAIHDRIRRAPRRRGAARDRAHGVPRQAVSAGRRRRFDEDRDSGVEGGRSGLPNVPHGSGRVLQIARARALRRRPEAARSDRSPSSSTSLCVRSTHMDLPCRTGPLRAGYRRVQQRLASTPAATPLT